MIVHALSAPILVTGAAGFAGSHLLDRLRADGRPIVGWHHPGAPPPAPAADAAASSITWQPVELTDPASVQTAIAACRPGEVYHLAGAANQGRSWDRTDEALRVNALGTHHLLEALRRQDEPARVLVIGSAAIYRPSDEAVDEDAPIAPPTPYGISKLAQEMVALQAFAVHGQPAIVSRSFNHIGPRQGPDYVAASFARQIAMIEAGQAPPVIQVGNLEPRRDLADVRDTVRAYELLMRHGQPGRVYNVCSGVAHAIQEILDGLLRLSTVRVDVHVDPARLRPVDQPLVLGRYDRLARETGWRPGIPWDRTLADLLHDWRERLR